MARKKRSDEEAPVGAGASQGRVQPVGNSTSKQIPPESSSNAKSVADQGSGRKSQKGIDASASRHSGAAPSAEVVQRNDGSANSYIATSQSSFSPSKQIDDFKEQAAAAAGAIRGATESRVDQDKQDVNMTGMSASRKKNLKKKLRRQEQKHQAEELQNAMQVGSGAAVLASRLNQFLGHWGSRESELVRRALSVSGSGAARSLLDAVGALQKEIYQTEVEEREGAKKPVNKRASTIQIQKKIQDVEITIQKQQKELQRMIASKGKNNTNEDEKTNEEWTAQLQLEESVRYLAHLREQLLLTQQQSDLREFQLKCGELNSSLEQLSKQVRKAMQNPGSNLVDARKSQQKESLWRRRLQQLGAIPPTDTTALTSITVILPIESNAVLLSSQGQPSLVLRKVERKFRVIMERTRVSENGVSFVLVSYSLQSCLSCQSFLGECIFPQIPIGLESMSNCVSLVDQNIGAIIGSGGSNLRRLEEELDVVLWLEDKWLTILGRKSAVNKALPRIHELRSSTSGVADVISPQAVLELHADTVRALSQGSAAVRGKVAQLEQRHAVTIWPRPLRKGETGTTATVIVKGSTVETCKGVCCELQKEFEHFRSATVECERMKANRILRGDVTDFSSLKKNVDIPLISLLRCDTGVVVSAPSSLLNDVLEVVIAAMNQMNRVTRTIEMRAADLRIFTRTRRNEIESLSGASCRAPAINGDSATLSFTGCQEAVDKAVELVKETLESLKEEELVITLATALYLVMDRGQRTHELEDQHNVKVRVDVPAERAMVRGDANSVEAIADALKCMQAELDTSGKLGIKHNVHRDSVSHIIGRQGANVRRLQSKCNLDHIVVESALQAIYMLGTQESLDEAVLMVSEMLENNNNNNNNNNDRQAPEENRDKPMRLTGERMSMRGGRGGLTITKGRDTSHNLKPAYTANADDENAFPSLGVCSVGSGGQWKKRGNFPQGTSSTQVVRNADNVVDIECLEVEDFPNSHIFHYQTAQDQD